VGRKAGLSDEKLRAVLGDDLMLFNDTERLVIELADALTGTPSNVSYELYARLRNPFSEEQLMQLGAQIALRIIVHVGIGSSMSRATIFIKEHRLPSHREDRPRNFRRVYLALLSKSGGAPPHSKTGARSVRSSTRPRFGVRQCFAALGNGDEGFDPRAKIHLILPTQTKLRLYFFNNVLRSPP
jgi:hypothetical protein